MTKIKKITASQILNSKGNWTVEATVVLDDGSIGKASCPSGRSKGKYEAVEIDVAKAILNIETLITPRLVGLDADNQQNIDKSLIELDGTQNKARLGANACLPVSMAVAKAAAHSLNLPLYAHLRKLAKLEGLSIKIPTPCFNLINGGKHASQRFDLQEFLVIPASSKSYDECLQIGIAVYRSLRKELDLGNLSTLVGDEGGYSPDLPTNVEALSFLKKSATAAGVRVGFDAFLGIDCAASSFFAEGKYRMKDKAMLLSSTELVAYYEEINNNFHLLYLEDPLAEDDWDGWNSLSTKISSQTIIVGDDLTATNPYRLQMSLDKKTISGIVIKPNQIGTIMEAMAVATIARQAGLKTIVSHRSGETNDDFIADFAVAVSSDYVKFGAPAMGERVSKYNRLLEINKEIKEAKTV